MTEGSETGPAKQRIDRACVKGSMTLQSEHHTPGNSGSQDPFDGTAGYYARYRYDYPDEIAEIVATTFGLDGTGRLLDVGCGTGKLTFLLKPMFQEAVGIDRSAGMLAEAERQATSRGVSGMKWVLGSAEDATEGLGEFRLVSCGEAFHWMDREKALITWHGLLEKQGGLAIVSTGGGSASGPEPWQQAMWEVIHRWLGPRRRNADWQERIVKRHEEVIEASGLFQLVSYSHVDHTGVRDLDSVLGFLYSTSFCNKGLLGENVPRFEEDLRRSLLQVEPSGRFTELLEAEYILAKRI